jgi:hypothetical protein
VALQVFFVCSIISNPDSEIQWQKSWLKIDEEKLNFLKANS